MKYIRYTAGYKYQLEEVFQIETGLAPVPGSPGNRFVGLTPTGLLTIAAGYAWDGASGPAIDTPSFMRGSLVHDALYQLIRVGTLTEGDRKSADQLLREICLEDGMWRVRAAWVYAAVRWFGGAYMQHPDEIITAP
jgi:hypothetical protein